MRRFGRLVVLVLALGAACSVAGCAVSGEEAIAVQESQLEEYIAHADGAAAEIFAQIPDEELLPGQDTGNFGGVQHASEYYEEWPKYYYWVQIILLRPGGPRTPAQVADDLEPWFDEQGWERNTDGEFPPTEESFERDYYRDGYHLIIRAYTVPPPYVQKLMISIVTPRTDPGRG